MVAKPSLTVKLFHHFFYLPNVPTEASLQKYYERLCTILDPTRSKIYSICTIITFLKSPNSEFLNVSDSKHLAKGVYTCLKILNDISAGRLYQSIYQSNMKVDINKNLKHYFPKPEIHILKRYHSYMVESHEVTCSFLFLSIFLVR